MSDRPQPLFAVLTTTSRALPGEAALPNGSAVLSTTSRALPGEAALPNGSAVLSTSRPYATALVTQPTPPVASPWLLQAQATAHDDATAARDAAALADARAKAIEEGRAEGLRETAALRATLQQLAAQMIAGRDAKLATAAEAIADCAIAAIEGWVATAPKQELFAPVVKAWLERGGAAATAKVHPSSVAALQTAIGDAPITIVADAALAPGDIKLRGEALDVSHAWPERLRELRDAIATALETA